MLTRLRFQNFKSWRKVDLRLAPLTALFGANSSGKSSLLQFLLLLKQTKDSPDRSLALDFGGEESLADLGSFRDAVHAHEQEEAISWRLGWRMPQELRIADPSGKRSEALFNSNTLEISSSVRLRNKNVVGDFLEYDFANSRFVLRREKERPGFQLEAQTTNDFRSHSVENGIYQVQPSHMHFPTKLEPIFRILNSSANLRRHTSIRWIESCI